MDYANTKLKRFNHLSAKIDAAYHDVAMRLGLSDSALRVLYTLCTCNGECVLNELVGLCGCGKQTVNSSLRKLEAQGLVRLEALDGRRKKVCLTGEGETFTNATVRRVIEIENSIFAAWSQAEYDGYLALTLLVPVCGLWHFWLRVFYRA